MKWRDRLVPGGNHFSENKIRAFLSILGVFIGVASVLCMISLGDGAKQIISQDIEKVGGTNQIRFGMSFWTSRGGRLVRTTERLTLSDALAIEAECPGIRFVLPKNERALTLVTSKNGRQARPTLEGVTPDYPIALRWEVQDGRFLSENDIDNATQVCVLGNAISTELFQQTSAIGQEIKVRYQWDRPVRLRVVGVMKPKGRSFVFSGWNLDTALLVPVTTYQHRLSGYDDITDLIIFTENSADMETIILMVYNILRRRHRNKDDFLWHWIPKTANERLNHIQSVLKIALSSIASFSLLVGGIGIMNICLVSVGEQTREIGLRKAVGASRVDIFYQYLTESICLCLCGTLLGIAGGWVAAHGMARVAVRILPIVEKWPVVLSGHWILISVLFSVFIGIAFGVYPAIRAARLSPIDALRSEN